MVKSQVFLYAKHFDESPKPTDFKLIEEELPEIKDGEFLAEAEYLSVDPYMKGFAAFLPVGSPFTLGTQVAKITESKHPKFPVGKYIVGYFGWRSHTITNAEIEENLVIRKPYILPDFGSLPKSLALGALGMPGNTAYFGVIEIIKPQAGEVVVVSGAGGAVGSIAGQIAKIMGATVIGIAGSEKKGDWLVNQLGFDYFINYKTDDVDKKLKEFAPSGVDGYFDNVAGEISKTVLQNIRSFGRVACCGIISTSFEDDSTISGLSEKLMLSKQLTVRGFMVYQWADRWMEGIEHNLKWVQAGKLKYQETITQGFANMPQAFVNMLKGDNIGKAVVSV